MRVWFLILAFVASAAAAPVADMELSLYPQSSFAGDVEAIGLEHFFSIGTAADSLEIEAQSITVILYERDHRQIQGSIGGIGFGGPISGDTREIDRYTVSGATVALSGTGTTAMQFREGSATLQTSQLEHEGIGAGNPTLVYGPSEWRLPLLLDGPTLPLGVRYASTDALTATAAGDFTLDAFALDGTATGSSTHQITTGYSDEPTTVGDSEIYTVQHARLQVTDGSMRYQTAGTTWGHAETSNINLNGSARLSLVEGAALAPDGTWDMSGEVSLRAITPSEDRLSAKMTGDVAGLAIDGTPFILPPATIAASVAGSLGILALIAVGAKFAYATALFTRLTPEEALMHERRQLIYEYIRSKPGATFREVQRETDIPAGTARHHLSVLERSKLIVEHGHRSTVRFFENHGKFDATWDAVVLLREPELEQVHGWLLEHPKAMQRTLLDHAKDAWGWSRSTTQHRLSRLVDGGLVSVMNMGRRKLYEAHDRVQRPSEPAPYGMT